MNKPIRPDNDAERLAALRAARLLDTPREQAFDDLVNLAVAVAGKSMAAVSLVDEDRQWFKARHGFDTCETPRDRSFCQYAILEPHRLMLVEDAEQDERFAGRLPVIGGKSIRFYAGVPLLDGEGMALGSLCVFDSVPGTLEASQAAALRALARQAGHVIELRRVTRALDQQVRESTWFERELARYAELLERQNAQLAEQARTDPLTGLSNRRAFSTALALEIERANVAGSPLCVALLDLDHFKSINDVHGHAEGDRVLAEVGKVLQAHFAAAGLAARYGGEEFALLLPGTTLDTARAQCELLRQAVGALPLGAVVSASIGVTAYRPGETYAALLERADEALYRAKRDGRNRVESKA